MNTFVAVGESAEESGCEWRRCQPVRRRKPCIRMLEAFCNAQDETKSPIPPSPANCRFPRSRVSSLQSGGFPAPWAVRALDHGRTAAFTFVELVAVMVIVGILLSITLAMTLGWGRGASIKAAARTVRASLSLARQWAVAGNSSSEFAWTNLPAEGRGCYVIRLAQGDVIGTTNYLPRGVIFEEQAGNVVRFEFDGSCGGAGDIVLREYAKPGGLAATVRVQRATGFASIVD